MKINLSFSNYTARIRQNVSVIILPVLLLLLLAEIWVLYQSYGILASSRRVVPTPLTKLIRINFGLYNTIDQQRQAAASFTPQPVIVSNPFGQTNPEYQKVAQ